MKIGALYKVRLAWRQHRPEDTDILLLVKYEEEPATYSITGKERLYTFLVDGKLEVMRLVYDQLETWMEEI